MNTVQLVPAVPDKTSLSAVELRELLETVREVLDMPQAGPATSAGLRGDLVESRAGAVVTAVQCALAGESIGWAIGFLRRRAAHFTNPYVSEKEMHDRWCGGETWAEASVPVVPEPDPVEPLSPEEIAELADHVNRERALGLGGGDQLLGVIAAYNQVRTELAEERAAVAALLAAISEELTAPWPEHSSDDAVRATWVTQRAAGVAGLLNGPQPPQPSPLHHRYRAMAAELGAAVAHLDPPPYQVHIEQPEDGACCSDCRERAAAAIELDVEMGSITPAEAQQQHRLNGTAG